MKEIEIIDPYGFIYITTNLINGKRYVGRCSMKKIRKREIFRAFDYIIDGKI